MSTQRALRLSRTFATLAVVFVLFDRDFIFNGLDLLTLALAGTSITLLINATSHRGER